MTWSLLNRGYVGNLKFQNLNYSHIINKNTNTLKNKKQIQEREYFISLKEEFGYKAVLQNEQKNKEGLKYKEWKTLLESYILKTTTTVF